MIPAGDFFNDAYFDSFQTPKYQFRGLFHRTLIRRLLIRVAALAQQSSPKTILDAGGGEGFFTSYLAQAFPEAAITVVDLSDHDLALLNKRLPNVKGVHADLQTFDLGQRFDLLVATEVLEHLPKPADALARFAQQAARIVVSVPWEPFFMFGNLARGKNVTRFGNDPEHVNHWTPLTLRRFLSREFTVDRIWPTFPWIAGAGHRRS